MMRNKETILIIDSYIDIPNSFDNSMLRDMEDIQLILHS